MELYQAIQNILLKMLRRSLLYSKILLKWLRYMKPSTYHMKKWCECQTYKPMIVKEINKLVLE